MRETDLYPPVKTYLEGQGYDVKAEIGDCDVLARRGEEEPVVVELKLSFSLALVMQGVARQTMFDQVYLALPVSGERGWRLRYRDILRLCRRLGLGLLAVRGDGGVEAHLDPGPYAPRRNAKRRGRLLKEFERRVGDPNEGGSTRTGRMTAYRQDALRLAQALSGGAAKVGDLRRETGVQRAQAILSADHYGWFERVSRGVYALTPKGNEALSSYAEALAALGSPAASDGGS